jgi:hypothetical protein
MDFLPDGPDLLVQDPDGQFVAVVEIKNLQNFTKETATILRQNPMKYSILPQIPYFLLMSQDKGFLWKEAWQEGPDTPPDYEFSMDNTPRFCTSIPAICAAMISTKIDAEALLRPFITEHRAKTNWHCRIGDNVLCF